MAKSKPADKAHITSFISDYGFKVTFADENSLFAKKAIELLAGLDSPIDKIEMLRNEFLGMTVDSRAGVYDVFCRDEQKRLFVIEMQATEYGFFIERILYYVFHLFNAMVKKGEDGFDSLSPIHCICIVENRITEGKKYCQKFTFSSEDNVVLYNKIEIHLVELGKFNIRRKDYSKITTEKEELIYTMKYGHEIDLRQAINVPPFWKKEWIDEAIAKLDQRNMTPEQYAMMEIGIFQINLIHHQQQKQIETAREEARKEAIKEGEALAKAAVQKEKLRMMTEAEKEKLRMMTEAEKEKLRMMTEAASRMVLMGMTDENIALVLQQTPEFVRNIRTGITNNSGTKMPEA